jgi:flagellin-like protein
MKRGISPLIATVLIIGFTIAVAGITFTFIRGQVKSQTESTDITSVTSCLDAEVKITSVCLAGNIVRIKVDNEGETPLTGIKYRVIGSSAVKVLDSDPIKISATLPMQQFERISDDLTLPTTNPVGTIEEVIAIPVIASGVCSSGEDSEKTIPICT